MQGNGLCVVKYVYSVVYVIPDISKQVMNGKYPCMYDAMLQYVLKCSVRMQYHLRNLVHVTSIHPRMSVCVCVCHEYNGFAQAYTHDNDTFCSAYFIHARDPEAPAHHCLKRQGHKRPQA